MSDYIISILDNISDNGLQRCPEFKGGTVTTAAFAIRTEGKLTKRKIQEVLDAHGFTEEYYIAVQPRHPTTGKIMKRIWVGWL